jgi:hypothetical protein
MLASSGMGKDENDLLWFTWQIINTTKPQDYDKYRRTDCWSPLVAQIRPYEPYLSWRRG